MTADIQNEPQEPRDQKSWAKTTGKLHVHETPEGATNLNVDGAKVTGPMQGFGQMWQNTFRVYLHGCKLGPQEVMKLWKENFTTLQPEFNKFYPSRQGVEPGEVMLIDSTVPVVPGTPGVLPVATGVMILYSDDQMFTVMTPEGHPESGWNTFSTFEEDGVTVAQIQSMTRATDPIYEFGLRFMGGSQMQENTWKHVLKSLAEMVGVSNEVTMNKTLIDSSVQWSQAKNIWKNAVVRTTFYKLATPFRWVGKRVRKSDKS